MIVVFGSLNVDLVARVPRLPQPGETLKGESFAMLPGGKGANQALAASRAGGDVHLFGSVGRADGLAVAALRALAQSAVDVAGVVECDAPTGVALIHVDDRGENCITVVAGANASARAAQVPDAMLSRQAIVLMQLEVPLDEVAALARRARQRGARVVLNAAPATRLPRTLLDDVDVLVVNETEALALCETATTDVLHAAHRLASASQAASSSLAARAARFMSIVARLASSVRRPSTSSTRWALATHSPARSPLRSIAATTLRRAIREGVAAGSARVSRAGAQDSLPARDAIAQLAATLAV